MTCAARLLTVVLLVPGFALAQGGSASGTLSERAYYIAHFRGNPDSARIELLLILRGEPGWMNQSVAGGGYNSTTASASIGRREPVRYSLAIGSVRFDYSYQEDDRTLRIEGARYPLDGANVVVIDNVDRVAGPPTVVRRFSLVLPSSVGALAVTNSLRQVPELQEFIR